jgi:hypothetical protein
MIANGEEERVATINVRPWAVELLVKLMKERGLPIEMNTSTDRYLFDKLPEPGAKGSGRGAGAGAGKRRGRLAAGLDPEIIQRIREQRGDLPAEPPPAR